MKNDDILYMLGDVMREKDGLDDPILERLANGELTQEEIDELAADENTAVIAELLRPLDKGTSDNLKTLFKNRRDSDTASSDEKTKPETKSDNVISIEKQRFKTTFKIAIPLAAAAALAAILLPSLLSKSKPLPTYTLEISSGEQTYRSNSKPSPDIVPFFYPSSRLEMLLRPETRIEDKIVLKAFLKSSSGIKGIDLPYQVSDSGTVIIEGNIGELLGPEPKKCDLLLVIGRESEINLIPNPPSDLLKGKDNIEPLKLFVNSFEIKAE